MDYQNSAKYRERMAADMKVLFPHLSKPDEQALARLAREALETAHEARRREIHQRFGARPEELALRLRHLTDSFEHLVGFLDQRESTIRRTGSDPLHVEEAKPENFKSVFLQSRGHAKIVAVGGGKGGIGKSLVAANLAIALATLGRQVVAVDMDLGGADLHLSLGLRALPRSLNDFIDRKFDNIDDVRLTTAYRNLTVIATDSSRLGAANIKYAHKEKILRHLAKVNCDIIIVDLGAEVSFNVLDVFLAADHRYVVTSTEPTSVLEAYGLIKLSLYRKLRHFASESVPAGSELGRLFDTFLFEKEKRENGVPKNVWELVELLAENEPELHKQFVRILYGYTVDLVINMSEGEGDRNIATAMTKLCQEQLALNLRHTYRIPYERKVREAARKLTPVTIHAPHSGAAQALFHIAAEAAHRHTDAEEMSRQVARTAASVMERVQKMREVAALSTPGQPVNWLIPLEESKESVGQKIRKFLNTEIHLGR
ncbi:MAG: P-loop NTPase [Candidatus Lernaella stagnicola]|nr:P-loop NTPase [Candidatus Lernaella stagnicola]